MEATVASLAGRLMRRAAASFHEEAVGAEARCICAEHALPVECDEFGNLLVRWQTDSRPRPLVLAAHLDHPGFKIVRRLGPRLLRARFLGGVPEEFFREGIPLQVFPGGISANLGKKLSGDKRFEIELSQPAQAPPQFAVWELEDFAERHGQIHGRACDDLIGCAAALATLIELKRRRARVNVIAVLSRAEEIGFLGALALADSGRLPRNSLVISLEASQERPPVRMGAGVMMRVGDRTSIFDSAATRFLTEVGEALERREKDFRFQRALMSGGTCEATAYQELGFQTGGVCVALGNYYNRASESKIVAEYVIAGDAGGMAGLLVEAARRMPDYPKLVEKLPAAMRRLAKSARRLQGGRNGKSGRKAG